MDLIWFNFIHLNLSNKVNQQDKPYLIVKTGFMKQIQNLIDKNGNLD